MARLLHISDRASLAVHLMLVLALEPGRWRTTPEVARALGVSENHLAKVRQRLARAGLLEAARGPAGGARLATAPEAVALLDVIEAVEGPLTEPTCLLGTPVCGKKRCLLGPLTADLHGRAAAFLSTTTLADLAREMRGTATGPDESADMTTTTTTTTRHETRDTT
jgi:Rrf2 family nitric oxide-sensitive transcriptional repressor